MSARPWHGVLVAVATPFREDLSIDFDRLQEHVAWLAANGCHGIVPNGSLGEYQTLTDDERADIVTAVVEAAPAGVAVVPGVGAYGGHQGRRWADQAAKAGATGVMSLPPNAYAASPDEVVAHFEAVAGAGLPVIAYNNPFDTKVDLTPELLARLFERDLIVGVKEFSGDVRRLHRIHELAPGLDVLAGADDVLLELVTQGAVGWIAGFPNALPEQSVRLFELCRSGDLAHALPLYRQVHAAYRWDSRPLFVQAIKLGMELAGRYGGPCRPPRLPLTPELHAQVTADMLRALGEDHVQ
ncbi:dihydrodipicolinate synthase family protein [Hamadaea tsunoensis]|uniref:dihydrodipicolinate synthase family protein n=1 Tax=Hamadaea tsunoensis TaxID=53368 RepID=UPI000421EB00|nr:dihydrodipicolinate synthase family protein [Hamadaea tsunoensis]